MYKKPAQLVKRISLGLISLTSLLTVSSAPAFAENWTLNGSDIYSNNSGNVGIGYAFPTAKLEVNGTAFIYQQLGIGYSPDSDRLTVNGSTKILGSPASTPLLSINSDSDGKYSTLLQGPNPGLALKNSNDPITTGLYRFMSTNNSLQVHQNASADGSFSTLYNIMTWNNGGNVGIGETAPVEKLDVNGRVRLAQTTAPAIVTDKLYNVGGTLYWNGSALNSGGGGGSTSWSSLTNPTANLTLGMGSYDTTFNTTGASPTLFIQGSTGKVAIGTTTTGEKLEVAGNLRLTNAGAKIILNDTTSGIPWSFNNGNNQFIIQQNGSDAFVINNALNFIMKGNLWNNQDADMYIGATLAGSTTHLTAGGATNQWLNIKSDGNVGIGTTAPENSEGWSKVLDVYGGGGHSKILTRSSLVTTGMWSHNTGFYNAPAGGIAGTWSNHPYTLITNKVARMTIDATGSVGIGTTSPAVRLHVASAPDLHPSYILAPRFQSQSETYADSNVVNLNLFSNDAENGASSGLAFSMQNVYSGIPDEYARIRSVVIDTALNKGALDFMTASNGIMAQAVRIDNDGNVGIGTGTAGLTAKLEVFGVAKLLYGTSGTTAVYKDSNGILSIQGSDQRLKKNITPIADSLAKIQGIKGVLFNWNTESDDAKKTVGVIAQDVMKVLPEATFSYKDEQGKEYYGVHYDKLSALLIQGIKDQQKEISELKQRLDEMEKRIGN